MSIVAREHSNPLANKPCYFDNVPKDVALHLFSFLTVEDLNRATFVNKKWHHLVLETRSFTFNPARENELFFKIFTSAKPIQYFQGLGNKIFYSYKEKSPTLCLLDTAKPDSKEEKFSTTIETTSIAYLKAKDQKTAIIGYTHGGMSQVASGSNTVMPLLRSHRDFAQTCAKSIYTPSTWDRTHQASENGFCLSAGYKQTELLKVPSSIIRVADQTNSKNYFVTVGAKIQCSHYQSPYILCGMNDCEQDKYGLSIFQNNGTQSESKYYDLEHNTVTCLATFDATHTIVGCQNGTLFLCDLTNEQATLTFQKGHKHNITHLYVHKQYVLSLDARNKTFVWDAQTGKRLHGKQWFDLTCHNVEKNIACFGCYSGEIYLWNWAAPKFRSGTQQVQTGKHSSPITHIQLQGDMLYALSTVATRGFPFFPPKKHKNTVCITQY